MLRRLYLQVTVFLAAFANTLICMANPVLNNISAGKATIQQTTYTTTINQTSKQAIFNWKSFNIQAGEATHFIQPVGGVALNRISAAQGASQIYGVLTSTGRIILINPAGIYFGPSAFVNVGSIIATTGNLTDADFLNGKYIFNPVAGYNGSIINAGSIIAANHGLVALVGANVTNNGYIQANLGHVVLASGGAFTMSFAGNDLINFTIGKATSKNNVTNNGSLIADGGRILVKAAAAQNVLDNVINMNGVAQAKSVYTNNGEIIISGDPSGGVVKVTGQLIASGNQSGGKGGKVKVTGYSVAMDPTTVIDVSGDAAGGKVETSGQILNLGNIAVNAAAANGINGSWIIDPNDLTICSSCISTASTLDVNALINALGTTNVLLQTTAAGIGGNGDIFVNAPINWTSANNLTLSAYRNINANANITNTGGANVTLQADNTGTGTGTVAFDAGKQVALSGGTGAVKIYYNPTTFGVQDTIYTGGTSATQYMLINSLGGANDTSTRSLASLANNSALWGQNFALAKNIDANATSTWNAGAGFSSIGNSVNDFTGLFDGQGYVIKNLTINSSNSNVGLFGKTSSTANISNLGVSGKVVGVNNVGLLVGNNAGTIENVFTSGAVIGTGTNIGGFVGNNTGALDNVESLAAVISTGSNVGGLVGNNSGTINHALAIGAVTGNSNVGALVGSNSNSIQNSFWNTSTAGLANAVGTNSGSAGVTGANTAALMNSTTFVNAGWDMANTWGIIADTSYPYLLSSFPTTPRIISGQVAQFTSYINNTNWAAMLQSEKNPLWSSLSPLALAQLEVTLAAAGNILDKAYTGANGQYYFIEGNNEIPDGTPVLSYLSNGSYKSNAISLAPRNGASLTNFYLPLNTVLVKDNGELTFSLSDSNYSTYTGINSLLIITSNALYMPIKQSDLVTALGSLNSNDLLYTASGNDIFVKSNNNFVTSPNTFYTLDGNLTVNHGSITQNGVMAVGPYPSSYNGLVTLRTTGGGNIYLNDVIWPLDPNPDIPNFNTTLFVDAANNIILHGIVAGVGSTFNSFGSLTLSAAYTNQSITTGGSDTHYIWVWNLNVLKGMFYQNFASSRYAYFPGLADNDPLNGFLYHPLLYTFNEFTLNLGQIPSTQVQFLRVGGGSGTRVDPYIIFDMYGLQGIGSDATTLSANYRLGGDNPFRNNDDKTFSRAFGFDEFWNNNQGFVPIGTIDMPFSGTFDGQNLDPFASGIAVTINRPNQDNIGIFGVTSSTAEIFNLILPGSSIIGGNNVGALVGTNYGKIYNIVVTQSLLKGVNNVGALVGVNFGVISNIFTFSNRIIGTGSAAGGIAGVNNGTIEKSLSAGYLTGKSFTGGIAGINNGIISNSFWDVASTGQKTASYINNGTFDRVFGGCLYSTCSTQATIHLGDPKTYLSLADGGSGFLSSSWDFTNVWAPSANGYPYLRAAYSGSTGTPVQTSGLSNAPNQLLYMVWSLLVDSGSIIYHNNSLSITGADGSFYYLIPNNLFTNNEFILMTFIGGNAVGSVGYRAKAVGMGQIKNQTNLIIPATFNNQPSNSTYIFNMAQYAMLFAGIPLSELVQLNNTTNFSEFLNSYYYSYAGSNTLFSAAQSLYTFNQGSSINSVLSYQYNLDSNVRDYFKNRNLDISNLDSLAEFQRSLDQQQSSHYGVAPNRLGYCGR